ncbi:methyltransferase domain-containing protein [Streptomyces sp. NPDC003077]|uniref:methyltransferase domain-containing protein n=1 Tax=Streptomyces sp. NPDC003077 TaxID=3154443 RepID=UPI0033A8332F
MRTDAYRLRVACMERIDTYGAGYFHGRDWLRKAFLAVPREHFVPDRVWWPQRGADGLFPLLDRRVRPRRWIAAVYRPLAALVTQIADGRIRPEDGPTDCAEFTSSISCPAVVVDMLHHLDPRPGDRVLEIGTGTGYNTALLQARVGAGNLDTIEIDEGIAARARTTLGARGAVPRVITGDGEYGHAPGAPYDRLLSTAAVREVPRAWLRQVRAGGVIVTPLDTPFNCDALLRLVCDGAGHATGHLIKGIGFMKLRGQRAPRSYASLGWPPWPSYRVTVGPDEQRITAGAGEDEGPVGSISGTSWCERDACP